MNTQQTNAHFKKGTNMQKPSPVAQSYQQRTNEGPSNGSRMAWLRTSSQVVIVTVLLLLIMLILRSSSGSPHQHWPYLQCINWCVCTTYMCNLSPYLFPRTDRQKDGWRERKKLLSDWSNYQCGLIREDCSIGIICML